MTKANNPDASTKQSDKHFAPAEAGTSGTKDASECASLRIGNLPKVEDVKTLPVEDEKGVAAKHAATQNSSLAPDGTRIRNVIPNNGKSVVTSGSK